MDRAAARPQPRGPLKGATRPAASVVLLAWSIGCTSSDSPKTSVVAGRPTVETQPLIDAAFCTPESRREPWATVKLQVWHTPKVRPDTAARVGLAAMAVWTRLGVVTTFTLKGPVEGDSLIVDTPSGPSLKPTQAILDQLPFVPDRQTVHVVAMERFIPPQSIATTTGVSLRGLTVSPRMPVDPNGVLARLNIQEELTPTVFMNMAAGPRAPGDLSLTPAHEVGHALGLVHRSTAQALMSDGELSLRCLPGLSDAERDVVIRQLGR